MNLVNEEKKYIYQTYRRFELILVKGKGQFVWDDRGKKYLDFFAGVSVCNIGHCHPRVVGAIKRQTEQLLHVSNHYYTAPQIMLARDLVRRTFPGQVFFSNSGAEANECAIKLVRKWSNDRHAGENRNEIIVFENSFHGRTMATLTATGQEKFHKGFEPLLPGFRYARHNDIASVDALINKRTAAVMIEPVLGEGGVYPASAEFIKALRSRCDKHNLLLVFDEIQTGLGRTGRMFAYEHYGIKPDIITLGKSLAGGLPIGATIAKKELAGVFGHGDHGSTFGGNPVPCAAAREVLGVISQSLMRDIRVRGAYFAKGLESIKNRYPQLVRQVRATGLMLAMELEFPGREIVEYCQQRGLLINCTQNTSLRFLPPFIITRADIDKAIGILEESLTWVASKR